MSDEFDVMQNRPRPRGADAERDADYISLGSEPDLNPPLAYVPQSNAFSGPGFPVNPLLPPLGPSQTDVQGSYTGVPMDMDERPVQDADDL